MTATDRPRAFLWAALGTPDEPPGRVEVTTCPVCAVLVPTAGLDAHHVWHRTGRGAR